MAIYKARVSTWDRIIEHLVLDFAGPHRDQRKAVGNDLRNRINYMRDTNDAVLELEGITERVMLAAAKDCNAALWKAV